MHADRLHLPQPRAMLDRVLAARLRRMVVGIERSQGSLRIGIENDGLWCESCTPEPDADRVVARGCWLDPAFIRMTEQPACFVLLPFFFRLDTIIIPAGQIYSYARLQSESAFFIARNLLYSALRSALSVTVMDENDAMRSDTARRIRGFLAEQYLSQLRVFIREPLLRQARAPELLRAAAYIGGLQLENPLMAQAIAGFGGAISSARVSFEVSAYCELEALRGRILGHQA